MADSVDPSTRGDVCPSGSSGAVDVIEFDDDGCVVVSSLSAELVVEMESDWEWLDEMPRLSRFDDLPVAPDDDGETNDGMSAEEIAVEFARDHATIDMAELDADRVLVAVAQAQRSVNLIQGRQLVLAAHWADLHGVVGWPGRRAAGRERLVRPGGDGTPWIGEFCPAEFGAVLGVSTTSAALLIADALDLRHRLPLLWARVQTGDVKVWVARKVASKTRRLTRDAAARVDRQVAPLASSVSFGRLEKILDAAILRADPVLAKTDAETAADEQGVWLGRETRHGIRSIFGKAAAPDLTAVDVSLDELARAMSVLGDTDSHDLRRAKALGLLADPEAALALIRRANEVLTSHDVAGPHDGTDPSRGCDLGPAVLYVHLTADMLPTDGADNPGGAGGGVARVARVHDVGPVLLGQVRDWLAHRQVTVKPVIDIPGMRPVDCYEAPARMGEAIRLRTPASPFPYAANLTLHGDNDHTEPYVAMNKGGPPGQTAVDNLAWMPRHPHRLKTHTPWHVTQPRSGTWLWRTPHGYHYLVDEHGTHPLGKL